MTLWLTSSSYYPFFWWKWTPKKLSNCTILSSVFSLWAIALFCHLFSLYEQSQTSFGEVSPGGGESSAFFWISWKVPGLFESNFWEELIFLQKDLVGMSTALEKCRREKDELQLERDYAQVTGDAQLGTTLLPFVPPTLKASTLYIKYHIIYVIS